ncbi:hypothetical protein KKG46_03665 [Patescibacteria group bacterium]|nr:hypothetical protein [Patescibacteria group bacterium]
MEEDQVTEDESSEQQLLIPDDVSELLRLFEMDIRCGENSTYYRVITSPHTDKILSLGKSGLGFVIMHLFTILEEDETNIHPMVFEAWHIIISFFADNLKAEDAPQRSDLFSDWLIWAANFVGIQFAKEPEDE